MKSVPPSPQPIPYKQRAEAAEKENAELKAELQRYKDKFDTANSKSIQFCMERNAAWAKIEKLNDEIEELTPHELEGF